VHFSQMKDSHKDTSWISGAGLLILKDNFKVDMLPKVVCIEVGIVVKDVRSHIFQTWLTSTVHRTKLNLAQWMWNWEGNEARRTGSDPAPSSDQGHCSRLHQQTFPRFTKK